MEEAKSKSKRQVELKDLDTTRSRRLDEALVNDKQSAEEIRKKKKK